MESQYRTSILLRIWDKKNRITKIVSKCEYIDPRQELGHPGISVKKVKEHTASAPKTDIHKELFGTNDKTGENNSVKYRINMKESEILHDPKCKRETEYLQAREYLQKPECLQQPDNKQEPEECNPTVLLSVAVEKKSQLFLKPLDETTYKTISITSFPFFIGKLKKNVDYCLEKDVVSRYHAKLTREEERYYITDLNSTNGTFVNQEAVNTYQKREIKIGDEIAFADIKFLFLDSANICSV
jgi:hypothetical protein